MKRKIYDELIKWKNNTNNLKPLMILGVRQCGKTYIINEFCKNEFNNYKYVNLLKEDNIIELYNSNLTSDEKYKRLKVLLNFDFDTEDTILFIDEIQESEKLISELKYFCEEHNKVKIIVAGSLLGVKLKRSKSSFPVGKVKMLTMYPMDFEEFLIAFDENNLIDCIKDCYLNNKQISNPVHEKALNFYRTYLITGGMPESVNNMINVQGNYIKYDTSILQDIVESYFYDMRKYVESENEYLKIVRTYNSLPSQLANNSNKFQYSSISNDARKREYESSLDWLNASNLVLKCKYAKVPNVPIEGFVDDDTFKLYLSDIGVLNNILKINIKDILTDNLSLYRGVITENYVANQLTCNGFDLYYWKNDKTAEIDFLIYTNDGIIPIEVKSGTSTHSKSLTMYIDKYKPKYAIRLSLKDFGYNPDTKIKSVPLYATFMIKNNN